MASTRVDVEKFNGGNDFCLWRLKIRAILIQQGLDSALDDEEDPMAKKKRVKALQVLVETRESLTTRPIARLSCIFLMKY